MHDARQLLQQGCNKLITDSATREPGHCQFYIRLPWHNIVQTPSKQAQLEGVEIGRQELAQERFLKHKLEKALARKLSEQQAAADKEVAAAMQTASHVTSLQQHIQELKVTMPFLHVCTQCSNIITSDVTHLGHLGTVKYVGPYWCCNACCTYSQNHLELHRPHLAQLQNHSFSAALLSAQKGAGDCRAKTRPH